jgi:hypothetical protein
MAYDDFTLETVKQQFALKLSVSPFCQNLPVAFSSATFAAIFEEWFPLAQQARSEKAKSELLVSPVLLEIGLGQGIAEMVAAQLFNETEGKPIPVIYGSVTSGKLWKFLKLEGKQVTIDVNEYQITPVERILGILKWMVDAQIEA